MIRLPRWWRDHTALRRRVADLENELRLARTSKINAVLHSFGVERRNAYLSAEIDDQNALIVRLREQLEPFQRRIRHPRTKQFVKMGKGV